MCGAQSLWKFNDFWVIMISYCLQVNNRCKPWGPLPVETRGTGPPNFRENQWIFKIYNRFLIILTLWPFPPPPNFKPVADPMLQALLTYELFTNEKRTQARNAHRRRTRSGALSALLNSRWRAGGNVSTVLLVLLYASVSLVALSACFSALHAYINTVFSSILYTSTTNYMCQSNGNSGGPVTWALWTSNTSQALCRGLPGAQ